MAKESMLERDLALQIRAHKLPPPKRELYFAKPRLWRFDFSWPSFMIAAEVEGGTHMKRSRHTSPLGFEADCVKYNTAISLGWAVYRFTGKMVSDGTAVEMIAAALAAKGQR